MRLATAPAARSLDTTCLLLIGMMLALDRFGHAMSAEPDLVGVTTRPEQPAGHTAMPSAFGSTGLILKGIEGRLDAAAESRAAPAAENFDPKRQAALFFERGPRGRT
jgi:hypothetical protein